MTIEQLGFFDVLHSSNTGKPFIMPVTLTPIADRLAVELSQYVLIYLGLSRPGIDPD